jgi:hypothetical protein
MTSVVDICNLALTHIGDEANVTAIAPPDGSTQAALCATYYPFARGTALEAYNWTFATKTAELSLLDYEDDTWIYAYSLPASCLKIIGLSPFPTDLDYQTDKDFTIEAKSDGSLMLLTNTESASCKYIYNITDVNKFSNKFIEALSYLLASQLSGALIKGDVGMKVAQNMRANYDALINQAAVSDLNQAKKIHSHKPVWMSNR